MQELLNTFSPGHIQFGGARMALMDVEAAFWGLRRQLEALVGSRLTNFVFQQAGANGGFSFARAFTDGNDSNTAVSLFQACLHAYQLAGFGQFTLEKSEWPLGRICVRATDSFESWMWQQHQPPCDHPLCAYTAGVLVGFINAIGERRDIVCIEHTCQACGDDACTFELLPKEEAGNTAVVTFDPDPFLSQQLNLLDILFDRMPMGIAIFDKNLRIRRFNPTWASFIEKYTSASAASVVPGIAFFDLLPDTHRDFEQLFARALAGETVQQTAFASTSDGITSYWDVVLSPLIDNGEVVGILDVAIDATERQQMLTEIQQNDAHLRSLLESAKGYAVYRLAVDPAQPYYGRVVLVSPSIRDVIGIQNPTDYANWFADIHPDDAERVIAANGRSMQQGIPFDETMRVYDARRQDWRWVHIVSHPVFAPDGTLTYFNGLITDITDQKDAEMTLSQLNMVLEQMVSERTRELSTLLEVSQNVSSTLELEPLLGLVLDQLRAVVNYDGASIFELHNDELRLLSYRGPIPLHSALRLVFPLAQAGANRAVIEQEQPIIIRDIYEETPLAQAFRDTAGDELETTFAYMRSWMGVPLILRGRVLGMISLDHGQPNYYSIQAARLAEAFASQVAVFMENARLYEQEQERREIAESLREILALLNTKSPLSETLREIIQKACVLLGADAAIITNFNANKGRISIEASIGLPPTMQGIHSLPLIDSEPNRASLDGRPFVVTNITQRLKTTSVSQKERDNEARIWLQQVRDHFNASISVPLLIKGTVYGDITLYYADALSFDDELINMAVAFGNQTALVIENARLYHQEQSRRQVAESLRDILGVLNSSLPLTDVMNYIAAQASRLMGPETAVAIYRINLIQQEAELAANYMLHPDLAAIPTLPLAITGTELVEQRRPLVIPNVTDWLKPPDQPAPVAGSHAIQIMLDTYHSYLAIPLIVRNEVFGGMAFHYPQPREFSDEDVNLALTLGSQVALAIENGRLYEQEQERRRVAEGLRDVLRLINTEMPLADALNAIVRQATDLMNADVGVLHHIDYEANFVNIEASTNLPAALHDITGFPLHTSTSDRLILQRQPVFHTGARATTIDPRAAATWPDSVRRWRQTMNESYRAFLAAPLVVQDNVYGSLAFYYHEPRNFNDEAVGVAMSLASQAGLAIENAWLRQQAKQVAVVAERNRLARELHDAVTQTLFSASLIAEVLPRIWEKDMAQGRQRLDELRELTRGALAEMRTLLLELRPATLTESSLSELLQQLTAAVIGRSRLPVNLAIHGERPLSPDIQVTLYRIAQEALNNIIKHAQATAVDLTLQFTESGVSLEIADNGRGFQKNSAGVQSLGLSIMQERAEKIGATLNITSTPGRGTTIRVFTTS